MEASERAAAASSASLRAEQAGEQQGASRSRWHAPRVPEVAKWRVAWLPSSEDGEPCCPVGAGNLSELEAAGLWAYALQEGHQILLRPEPCDLSPVIEASGAFPEGSEPAEVSRGVIRSSLPREYPNPLGAAAAADPSIKWEAGGLHPALLKAAEEVGLDLLSLPP